MPTSSTVLTVEDQLVTLFDAAVTVPVTYTWPGPQAAHEAVFLGLHPEVADIVLDLSGEDPVLKAGRRQNREEYEITVTVWAFRPDEDSASGGRAAAGSVHAIIADLYDVWANNVKLGLDAIIRTEWRGFERRLFPFQSGWACEARITIGVEARLQ